ncbi:asparagine synthase-related protein [Rhodohalobacter sp.]|uniref:asparagine synthase-related protein n=1 Tax=Rhodohalobacter sp. TaxID=1974210 RepID=UPI003A0FC905
MLLEKAVQRQLVSDVPLGVLLSGGIDSSAIVAYASRYIDNLDTYSIEYDFNIGEK